VAESYLLLQLLRFRLARQYGWLFGYYLVDVVGTVALAGRSPSSFLFGLIYFVVQCLATVLGAGFALQIWQSALRGYPAVARFGRRFGIYLQVGAALVAASLLLLNPPRGSRQAVFTHYFNAFQGAADAMVFLFLLAAGLFLVWFPVKLSRNTAVCAGLFFFLLFKNWAILLLLNLYPAAYVNASQAKLILDLLCQVCWIFALRPEGETANTVSGHRWNQEETGRLLRQLDAINARLSHMAERKEK
jgi:hypothetical protein